MFFTSDSLLSLLFAFFGLLLSLAYITLLERKLLAGFQLRKGPNVASLKGGLLPLFDFFKLMQAKTTSPTSSKALLYSIAPFFSVLLSFSLLITLPSLSLRQVASFLFLILSTLHLLPLLCSAWASNRAYASLSVARGGLNSLSYEVPLITFCLSFTLIAYRVDFNVVTGKLGPIFFSFLFLYPLSLLFLAERHRLPFDFVEAERELVRGYNVEYGGWLFSLVVVAEYSSLLLLGQIISAYFFWLGSSLFSSFIGLFLSFCFLSLRGALPRFSWASFLCTCWLFLLPLSFLFFAYALCFSAYKASVICIPLCHCGGKL